MSQEPNQRPHSYVPSQDFFVTEERMNPNSDFIPGQRERKYRYISSLIFPCLLLGTEKPGLEMYLVDFLKGQVHTKKFLTNEEDAEQEYALFIELAGQPPVNIGYIYAGRLKILLDSGLFNDFSKGIYLSHDEHYDDEMVFAFCTV